MKIDNYVGKLWIKEPRPLRKIAEDLGLNNIQILKGKEREDAVGHVRFQGSDRSVEILLIVAVSWGSSEEVSKVRFYMVPGYDSEEEGLEEAIWNWLGRLNPPN